MPLFRVPGQFSQCRELNAQMRIFDGHIELHIVDVR